MEAVKGSFPIAFRMQFPELDQTVDAEMTSLSAILAQEEMELQLCEMESDGVEEIRAMDSGSIASVINPGHLPAGIGPQTRANGSSSKNGTERT